MIDGSGPPRSWLELCHARMSVSVGIPAQSRTRAAPSSDGATDAVDDLGCSVEEVPHAVCSIAHIVPGTTAPRILMGEGIPRETIRGEIYVAGLSCALEFFERSL